MREAGLYYDEEDAKMVEEAQEEDKGQPISSYVKQDLVK